MALAFANTSFSLVQVGTGTRIFTLRTPQDKMSVSAGTRMRAIAAENSQVTMEGRVASLTGMGVTTEVVLTLTVDRVAGAGSWRGWRFEILDGGGGEGGTTGPAGPVGPAGEIGPTGPAGADGIAGPVGPEGPTGPAASASLAAAWFLSNCC
jgi:hypothetical protein